MKALCSTDLRESERPVEDYEDNESENELDDNDNNMHEKQDAAKAESTSEGRHDESVLERRSSVQPRWMWEMWQACCETNHMRPL